MVSTTVAAGPAPVIVRSARVIDQIDNRAVATTGVSAFDSAQAAKLDIQNASGWWESVVPGGIVPSTAPPQTDLHTHESDQCVPEQIAVNEGRARFLLRRKEESGQPVLRASLLLSTAAGASPRVIGDIRNLSDIPLADLHLRTRLGVIDVPLGPAGRLPPNQDVKIDLAATGPSFSTLLSTGRYQNYGYFGSRSYQSPLNEQDLWAVVPDLDGRRTIVVDGMIERDPHLACLYARAINPASPFDLTDKKRTNPEHFEWIRALVRLAD
jgi:hypothetical protein